MLDLLRDGKLIMAISGKLKPSFSRENGWNCFAVIPRKMGLKRVSFIVKQYLSEKEVHCFFIYHGDREQILEIKKILSPYLMAGDDEIECVEIVVSKEQYYAGVVLWSSNMSVMYNELICEIKKMIPRENG